MLLHELLNVDKVGGYLAHGLAKHRVLDRHLNLLCNVGNVLTAVSTVDHAMNVIHSDHVLWQHGRITSDLGDVRCGALQWVWGRHITSVAIARGQLFQLKFTALVEALKSYEANRGSRFNILVHEVEGLWHQIQGLRYVGAGSIRGRSGFW